MIKTYKEILNKYGSDYQINKTLEKNEIHKVDRGLYSDTKYNDELEIISKKYPNAIFTLDSAFYYWNLIDVIPEKYYIATGSKDYRIKSEKVVQIFTSQDRLNVGKTTLEVNSVSINIYDRERLLIELLRRKNTMAFDYYKEIITNYRKIKDELDTRKIENYLKLYNNESSLYNALMREVY